MARPVRLRRLPLRLSEDENILGFKSRNSNNKITEANTDNRGSLNDATKAAAPKTKSEKGILLAGKKIVTQIPRSPALRDRTNLPAEPFKVDILVNKGADDNTMKKTTKALRPSAKRPVNEDVESEAPIRAKRLRLAKTKDPEPAVESTENLPLRKERTRKAVPENENTLKAAPVKENARKVVAKKEKTKKVVPVKEDTENASSDEENTLKAAPVKENTRKVVAKKEKTKKVVPVKEDTENASLDEENTENASSQKENTENAILEKVNTEDASSEEENMQDVPVAKGKRKNEPAKGKAKKLPVKATSRKLKVINEASASTNEDGSLVVESENAAESPNTPKVRNVKAVSKRIVKRVAFSKLSLSQQSNRSIANRKKKSLRRSSELQKKAKDEATASGAAAGKKFFKSKGIKVDSEKNSPSKKVATSKRRKVERPTVSTSFRLRQTTLSESFAKQAAKKNLRPRVAQKNYHESTIADKTGPVYKTAKLLEKSDEDGSEIYEFHFDSNDSRERIPKKKKKRVARNVITKKRAKASGTKKAISKPKVAPKSAAIKDKVENVQPVPPAASNESMDTNDVPAIVVNDVEMSPVVGNSEKVKTQPKRLEPQPERVGSLKPKPKVVESLNLTKETKLNLTSTPQPTKSSERNAGPLRKTNAFMLPSRPSFQYRTMLNHVLLNKSLSPIKKALENFDPGSPWRTPVITGPQFSRVKDVVQSTPQVRKFSTLLDTNRNSLELKAQPALVQTNKISEKNEKSANVEQTNVKTAAKMNKITEGDENNANVEHTNIKPVTKVNKIVENDENNANVEHTNIKPVAKVNKIVENDENKAKVEQTNIKSTSQKVLGLAKSPRKFGTVISNVNVAIPSPHSPIAIPENNAISELNRGSPRKNPTVTSPLLAELSDTRISVGNNFSDYADKENSIPVFTSPKKSQKSPKKLVAKSPLRPFNQAKIATKEKWEPQPGPSGLQKRSPSDESRILRQSNLNNFLNIDEVPTSTRISTAHGIFSDAHSTPIPGKPVKVKNTEPNVENAFGFDDIAESDVSLSPIKSNLFADPPTAKVAKKILEKRPKIEVKKDVIVPSRFSIGEIKKHLRPVVSKDKADSVERIEKDENREKGEKKADNAKGEDSVTFSDTFDVLTAAAEANDKENVQEVPLFADLEPVHFKQPPRHSYKRKRIVAFNFSEDEEENEDRDSHDRLESNATKKRKLSKVEKQRQKQMEEWAKGLNNTFEEIDQFDLVVENQ